MNTANFRLTLVSGHLRFISDMASDNDWNEITKWVGENLISENLNITSVSINSFFEAEKEFIRACISAGNFNKIKPFLDAVDNERFDKSNLRYKKLKLNQCKALADGMQMAERFLKGNDAMRQDLDSLLQAKRDELQELNLEEREQSFRDKTLSTSIDAALKIVHACPTGSVMGK